MATVINNPGEGSDGGAGIIIGVVVALILIVLFFVYGLPALRGNQAVPVDDNDSTNIQVDIPLPGGDDTPDSSGGSGNGTSGDSL